MAAGRTRAAAAADELTAADVFGADDASEGDDGDGWNGRSTDVVLARPIVRDQRPAKIGERVRFAASLTDGEWRGPEADNLRDLIALGCISGTEEHDLFREAQALIDHERGVRPHEKNPDGLPSLRALDNRRFLDMHRGLFRQGPDAMAAAERNEVQSAVRELADAAGKMAEAMTAVRDAATAAKLSAPAA